MCASTEPVIGLLAEEWETIEVLCCALGPAQWDLPTECPGWSVRDVLSHLVGTERSLLGESAPGPLLEPPYVRNALGAVNEAWVAPRRARPGAEVLAEFTLVAAKRLSEMRSWETARFDDPVRSPVGVVAYREFMLVRVMDCWVHEQDVRVATGIPGHRSGPAAEVAMRRLASGMGFVVGKKASAREGASVLFDVAGDIPLRLTILVTDGRAHEVDDLARAPDVRLKMDQQSFWRLACGRVGGEDALSRGLVEIGGDPDLGHRVVRSMGFMV